MLTLDLALITYGADGISRLASMYLPRIEGIRYVVSWQNDNDAAIPDSLMRDDIFITRLKGKGAARNRNNAIDHCTADLILFADDDLIYTDAQLRAVIQTFENDTTVDLATFKAIHPAGPAYPSQECRLEDPLPKGYWVAAFQIAFRRKSIGNLRCHPEFGAGAELFTGADDELFLLSAIRRGLNCRFFPITICEHPQLSTGTTAKLSDGNLRAMGCYIAIAYPWSSILRIPLKAWRVSRTGQASLPHSLFVMAKGAAMAPKILRGDRRYLW